MPKGRHQLPELRDTTPEKALGYLKKRFGFKYDYQLAHFLGVSPSHIIDVRGQFAAPGARLMVAILDRTDLSIKELRTMFNFEFIPGQE